MSRGAWIIAVLLATGVALFAVEIGKGAFNEPGPKIANPCHERGGRTGGFDTTIQRIVLDGLDGAACRLHTTREELVLSLGSGTGVHRRWDEHTVEVALRAGLLRSLDAAVQRGDVPSFLEPLLRRLVENAPLDKIVKGGFKLSDLLG